MHQNIERMAPRGYSFGFEDEQRTRNANRARKRQVNREQRGNRRRKSIMLRQVISTGDYADWL